MSLLVLKFLLLLTPILLAVAFLTLLERKLLSLIGLRLGPNKVSFFGFLQPLGDAIKLMNKQVNSLSNSYMLFYYLGSFFSLLGALSLWAMTFSEPSPICIKFSFIFMFLVLGFNSLNSIICGWSTFSKYSLIGSLRTVSQLISYEGSLYLCLFFIVYLLFTFSFYSLNFFYLDYLFLLLPLCFFIWVPSFLAELNRTPYDFSEGESELVSGFNTEFGSKSFTLIFLSEYSNIIFFCVVTSFLFFFGSLIPFFFFFFFFLIWIRSVLPRFRFDKLMYLSWKFFIPFLTFFFMVLVSFL